MWPTFSQNAFWAASGEGREETCTHGPSFIGDLLFPLFLFPKLAMCSRLKRQMISEWKEEGNGVMENCQTLHIHKTQTQ